MNYVIWDGVTDQAIEGEHPSFDAAAETIQALVYIYLTENRDPETDPFYLTVRELQETEET